MATPASNLKILDACDQSPSPSLIAPKGFTIEPVDYYVERPDLERQMRDQLFALRRFANDNRSRIVAVWGYGGTGKTELVRRTLVQNQSMYSSIFWVDACRITDLRRHLQRIHQVLLSSISPMFIGMSDDLLVLQIAKAINLQFGHSVWVMDSVDEDVPWRRFLPPSDNLDYLVIGRKFSIRDVARDKAIDVGPMSESEAMKLFQRVGSQRLQNKDEYIRSELLAKKSGYLPSMVASLALWTCDLRGRTFSDNLLLNRVMVHRESEVKSAPMTVENYIQCRLDSEGAPPEAPLNAVSQNALATYHPMNNFGSVILKYTILRAFEDVRESGLLRSLQLRNIDKYTVAELVRACDEQKIDSAQNNADGVYALLRLHSNTVNIVTKDDHTVEVAEPFLTARSYLFRDRLSPDCRWPIVDINMKDLEIEIVYLLRNIVESSWTNQLSAQLQDLPSDRFEQLYEAIHMYGIVTPDFQLPSRPGMKGDVDWRYWPPSRIRQRGD